MRRALAALFLPLAAGAQEVVVRQAGPGGGAAIIRRVTAGPHAVLAGDGRLDLPRDSTVTTSLVVLGRPTYLASRVQGDVVVVGADLFLRPGADVSGRAVSIGGTVALTTLGQAGGGTESVRDENFTVQREADRYLLDYKASRVDERQPIFQLPGIRGLLIPSYDRVDGLSLPVGVKIVVADGSIELEPTATYRSRLGVVDPGATLRIRPDRPLSFEARVARDTRTNDAWIYSTLVNSLTTFLAGTDTRNYFRSDLGEATLTRRLERTAYTLSPFVGGRYERVKGIRATGNVFSVLGRTDTLKIRRRNPLVERGDVGSAFVGAELASTAGVVAARARGLIEQSIETPGGTGGFTQLTVDGRVSFRTIRTQSLHIQVHGVATRGDSTPAARFAYLGGSGTLSTLALLEQGGSQLLFVENRYRIPIEAIQLPFVGAPIVSLRDAFGSAGVGSLPSLHHEVGIGLGLSALNLDLNKAVTGNRRTKFSIGISLSF